MGCIPEEPSALPRSVPLPAPAAGARAQARAHTPFACYAKRSCQAGAFVAAAVIAVAAALPASPARGGGSGPARSSLGTVLKVSGKEASPAKLGPGRSSSSHRCSKSSPGTSFVCSSRSGNCLPRAVAVTGASEGQVKSEGRGTHALSTRRHGSARCLFQPLPSQSCPRAPLKRRKLRCSLFPVRLAQQRSPHTSGTLWSCASPEQSRSASRNAHFSRCFGRCATNRCAPRSWVENGRSCCCFIVREQGLQHMPLQRFFQTGIAVSSVCGVIVTHTGVSQSR